MCKPLNIHNGKASSCIVHTTNKILTTKCDDITLHMQRMHSSCCTCTDVYCVVFYYYFYCEATTTTTFMDYSSVSAFTHPSPPCVHVYTHCFTLLVHLRAALCQHTRACSAHTYVSLDAKSFLDLTYRRDNSWVGFSILFTNICIDYFAFFIYNYTASVT
jgi:hypothetical protein